MLLINMIVGHLVGDYILQTDWMASGKKTSSLICLLHCVMWSGAVLMFGFALPRADNPPMWVPWLLLVTHYIQDRGTLVSRWMGFNRQQLFRDGLCAPWSTIVVDNVLHILVLYFIALVIGG